MSAITAGEPVQQQASALHEQGGDLHDGEQDALLAPEGTLANTRISAGNPLAKASTSRWYTEWRYRIALTAALGEAIVYGQRIAVPLALVRMQAELGWDKETQGIVMTGFWVGYAAMQIPGGWATTRWGPRSVVGAGLLASSIMHLMMPSAAVLSSSAMTALRVLQGVSQGVMVPGYAVLWSSWAPTAERSRLSAIPQVGGYIGTIGQLALGGWQIDLVSGPLSAVLGGWQAVYTFNAVLGLLWMISWFTLVYDSPKLHPHVSVTERSMIEQSLARELEASDAAAVEQDEDEETVAHSSWSCALYKRMLQSKPVAAICCASFCHNTGNYMLIDGFPAYMRDVAGASMTSAGLASALPNLALAALTTAGAVIADYLRGPRALATVTVRRLMHTVATSCQALLLALVGTGALQGLSAEAIVGVLAGAVGIAGLTVGGGFVSAAALLVPFTTGTSLPACFP